MTDFVHYKESSEDTQRHLDENRDTYENHAAFLLAQMMRGEILTAKTVVQKYGIADRRLRDLENEGKCKKRWKLNDQGKRMFVEFYCEISHPPTKAEVHEKFIQLQLL